MSQSTRVHQDDDRPPLPRPHPGFGLLLSLAVALLITLGEVDHLLAQILDPQEGRVWSVNSLSGVTAVGSWDETWEGWRFFGERAAAANDQADGWLRGYAVVDVLFALVYGALGHFWFRRFHRPGRAGRLGRLGSRAVYVGAAADVVESLQLLLLVPHPLPIMLTTVVKWAGVLFALALALWTLRHALARLPRAFYTHRYSAAIVLPLALLSLGRGPDLLEQLPDIQRAWADPGGFGDFVAAGFAMVLLGIAALLIGRQRTGHLWRRTCPRWSGDEHPCGGAGLVCPVDQRRAEDPMPLPLIRLWFIGPVVLVLGALALWWAGAPVRGWALFVFCLIPAVIGGVSLWLRRRWRGSQAKRVHRDPISLARFTTTALVGDVLVGLLPVVAGLGVIRAFAGPISLDGPSALPLFLVIAGVVSLVLAWPVLAYAHDRLEEWRDHLPPGFTADGPVERLLVQLTPGVSMKRGTPPVDDPGAEPVDRVKAFLRGFAPQRSAWTVLLGSGVAMVLIALFPVWLADHLGVIATFQLALGSISVLVASSVILFQPGGSPELFWKLRVPFAPVTSLVVLATVFGALAGGDDVHRIRPYAGPHADLKGDSRPELGTLFEDWLRTGRSCSDDLEGAPGLKIRPLLLYAAEGGGIRAAYWTTASVDLIATAESSTGVPVKPVCRSAFLSSGASGGSVGLSIASVTEAGTAADAVTDLAGPEALGAASDGLVLRDTIYAATGIPLPSLRDRRTRDADWSDRATLIEHAWERAIPAFDTPWLRPRPTWKWSWGPTGALVVNSTSPTTSCRTLISQVRLPSDGSTECAPGQPAAASTDLVECTQQLRTTTAALLTARFPYVTPSGVVRCTPPLLPDRPPVEPTDLQVVDGGYAENTGVGTLVDLMPRILAEVRSHNDCVLADPRPAACTAEPAVNTLVVPQLVYFDNGTGSDLVRKPSDLKLEALVPPLTILQAKGALYSARAQLERAYTLLATDQLWSGRPPVADAAAAAVAGLRTNQVAVVLQKTRPTIAAPLGWMLSEASIRAMDDALCRQNPVEDLDFGAARVVDPAQVVPEETEEEAPSRFGTIEDVLAMVKGTSAACRD